MTHDQQAISLLILGCIVGSVCASYLFDEDPEDVRHALWWEIIGILLAWWVLAN